MYFRFALATLLLCLLCLLLTSMGIWQLNRAKLKQNILDAAAKMQAMAVADCQESKVPAPWQKCKIKGELLSQRLYLDNQFNGHELGYNILGFIQLPAKKLLLVDLGWLALGANRQDLPRPKLPQYHTWVGQAYYPTPIKFKLGGLVDRRQENMVVIERIDLPGLAKLYGQPILPWVLRMSLHQKTGLNQAWKLVSTGPERHYAYALQWFTMAAIVFGILIWRMIKQCKRKNVPYSG